MPVDMRLISINDGGRFAMSWLAGTNPKALRSNTYRSHVYTLDVNEVWLCFGTIKIYSEQVQHLYNVTLNFVCFNTFFLKQYSQKRKSTTVGDNEHKKRRMNSFDSVDITNLLMESEVLNEYSEEKFEFPQEASSSKEKKITTSTRVHIKEITIRQISWDCRQPDEEDAFGEASQDERNMLLYEMSGKEDDLMSEQSSIAQKRKSPTENNIIPDKRWCHKGMLDNSLEVARCAPTPMDDESVSEFNIDYRSQSVGENPITIREINEGDMVLNETAPSQLSNLNQRQPQCDPLAASPNILPVPQNEPTTSFQELPNPVRGAKSRARKRPLSHLIIDKSTKIGKIDLDYCRNNIWENCLNRDKKEHIIKRFLKNPSFTLYSGSVRCPKLLGNFKKSFKTVQKQKAYENRLLLVEEILGDDFETYKSEFKLTAPKRSRSGAMNTSSSPQFKQNVEDTPTLPVNDQMIDFNNNCREFIECLDENLFPENTVTLKCSLDKINPHKIKFDFPNDTATQSTRSNWGKEGILRKLLSLWKTTGIHVSMTALIVGANRINAALAFHTLLDLAGQQYVDIIKDNNNSIKFINMGAEIIRKINNLCT